jgi:glucosamine--fructose-6-phosphate aminotransferase (isomerizing)
VSDSFIHIYKDAVRVETLQSNAPLIPGTTGIGHTRWATHGEPSLKNAHPHCDCTGNIAVVHNGVITNYQILKEQLIREGHFFRSETDTEVISHLIEKYFQGDLEQAVMDALKQIEGSYAIAVLIAGENRIVTAKNGSPLIIGLGDQENLIASDIPALLDYTDQVIYLEDGDLAVITSSDVKITEYGKEVYRPSCKINWNAEDVHKGGYEHFMMKEIHEQPRVIRDTISKYNDSNSSIINRVYMQNPASGLLILACGTSYHAGLIGKYVIEDLLDVPTRAELASEINHRNHITRAANIIAITQSGETADVIVAMKKLKENGRYLSLITNVRGCSASRLADETIYIYAGPEISVAATKSFIAQLTALYQLALSYPGIDSDIQGKLSMELRLLPNLVQQVIDNDEEINKCARFISRFKDAFFIGRGINYPVALEGALKLKEISYLHADGYAAGELKHGPFSLLQPDTPVIAIAAQDKTYDSMLTNIKEVKSRKAPVIAVISEDDHVTEKLADFTIKVPHTLNLFSPVVNTVALQLLSYHVARYKSCSIDFPRNLAKSVTVE